MTLLLVIKGTLGVHDMLWQDAHAPCWARQFGAWVFRLLLNLFKMGLELGRKSSHSQCQAYHFAWEDLSLLLAQGIFYCSAMWEHHIELGWPRCYVCSLRGGDRSHLLRHERGACEPNVLCQLAGETLWPWVTDVYYWSWSCSVSSLYE